MNITIILILVNVVAYVWLASTGGPANYYSLVAHGALVPSLVLSGQTWRIVTGAFLHGGLAHIALNMLALAQLGMFVERLVGSLRMLVIYALSLLGSGLAVVYFGADVPTVGASGAIYGLFGALIAVGLRLGKPGRALVMQTLPVLVLNLLFTFTFPNISAAGHIGGLIVGFIVGFILGQVRAIADVAADEYDPAVEIATSEGSPGERA